MLEIVNVKTLPMLLSVKKAIEVSGLSRSEIYRRLSDGTLKRRKVGRSTMIPTASLVAMVNNLPEG